MCGRPLGDATVSIPSRDGPLPYGPVCARRAGLLPRRRERVMTVPLPRRRPKVDVNQLPLEGFAK